MSLLQVEVVDDVESHKYVHSLLDFILFPDKLDLHLAGLKDGSVAFPSGPDLIRVCLQQAMAAQARDTGTQQQSQQQASPSVAGETPPQAPWQGPLSPPASASQHKRTKLLASWAAKIGHVLELSLDTIEKELPINMQQPLLMHMCQHYPEEKTHEVDYYRWVLRALMRSVSLNFIVPSLQVTGGKINKDSASAEDTSKEGDKENKKPSGDASVPARTVLKNWLSQYRDFKFDKTQQTETQGERKLEQYLITVPFELGEFHFFVEDFAEAERLFVLASERATTYTSKYSVTEAKKWPIPRERVEGFLRACRMIGYRVHTRDSPLRVAQGITDIIEEFKAQQVGSTSSMLMLQLEELRLSIAAISYSTCSEAEKIKRKEELTWKLWDLLMKDNFSDDINWSYRLYLAQSAELSFMRDRLFILNDLKLALRDYSLCEKSSAAPFSNSILLPLRSSVSDSRSHSEFSNLEGAVTTLPPSLRAWEDLLPVPAAGDQDSSLDTKTLHLSSQTMRFLFAASIHAVKRFSELGPLRFGTATQTPSSAPATLTHDFLSEEKVKVRIGHFLYRTAQKEDTVACWEALRRVASLSHFAPQLESACPAIDAALTSARMRRDEQEEIGRMKLMRTSTEGPRKREQPATPEDTFATSLGWQAQLLQMAGGKEWQVISESNRPKSEADATKDDEKYKLAYLVKQAENCLHLGQLERSCDLYNQLISLIDARKPEEQQEHEYWAIRHEAVYGILMTDIQRWETIFEAWKQNERDGSRSNRSRELSTDLSAGAMQTSASALTQKLSRTLAEFGPPERGQQLTVIMAFLFNSRQWEADGGHKGDESVLHQYCREVETICTAVQQAEQKRKRGEAAVAALPNIPLPLAAGWSVPPFYGDTVRLTLLLADLCKLATRHLRTLVEIQDVGKVETKQAAQQVPSGASTDAMNIEGQGEIEEGEAREEVKPVETTLGSLINRTFGSLLELLVIPQSPTASRYSMPRVEWSPNRGLLSRLWDETCLESLVGMFAGSLYHVQRQAQVPSMLSIENYGYLAQLTSGDGFFDRASPQTVASLWEVFRATLQRLNSTQPQSERWLFGLGDAAYEVSQFGDAVRYYLLGGGINNSFFCEPSAPISAAFLRVIPRLVTSLISIHAYLEAVVLCQFYTSPDYTTAFKAVQSNPAALREPYFQYLWEIPILELLVNLYTKIGQNKRAAFLIDLIGQKELNECNGAGLRGGFIRTTKQQFLKTLSRQFLMSPATSAASSTPSPP